jgi:hypothetical protein
MIIDENKYHYLPVLDGNLGKDTDTVWHWTIGINNIKKKFIRVNIWKLIYNK